MATRSYDVRRDPVRVCRRDGECERFRAPVEGELAGELLRLRGRDEQAIFRTNEIAYIEVSRLSTSRTFALVVGIGAALLATVAWTAACLDRELPFRCQDIRDK